MSALIGLAFEIAAYLFVGTVKMVWYGGKYLVYGPSKTEEEKRSALLNEQLHLMNNKLDRLEREVKEEKKLKDSITLRRSI